MASIKKRKQFNLVNNMMFLYFQLEISFFVLKV